MCTCVYGCVHVYMSTSWRPTGMPLRVCVCVCMCACVYVCVQVCTCVHERLYLLETHGDALAQAVELDRAVLV